MKIHWSCRMTPELLQLLLNTLEKGSPPWRSKTEGNEAMRSAIIRHADRTANRLEQWKQNLRNDNGLVTSFFDIEKVPHPFSDDGDGPSPEICHQDQFHGDLRDIPINGMLDCMKKMASNEDHNFEDFKILLKLLDEQSITKIME